MSDIQVSDRLLRLSPLVLRLGIAGVLACSGFAQVSPVVDPETGQAIAADAAGIAVNANWSSVLGVAQMGVGLLLLTGLLTRVTSLGVLGGVGYCVFAGISGGDAETLSLPVRLFESSGTGMLLLAAGCASLLVSGAGYLGLDNRLFGRKQTVSAEIA